MESETQMVGSVIESLPTVVVDTLQNVSSTVAESLQNTIQQSTFLRPEPASQQDILMNGWNAPEEMLSHIPAHWMGFEAPRPFDHYLLGVVYSFFFLFACVGNAVVIWVFLGSKSLRTPSNAFLVNLAVTDFLMMSKTPIFIYNSFNQGPALGLTACKVYAALGALSGGAGGISNMLIAFDRYRTIARPFDGKLTKTQVMILILAQYTIVLPFTILPAFELWNRYVPEGYLTSCTADYLDPRVESLSYIYYGFIFTYMLPALAIILNYGRVYSHVRHHEKAMKEQAKKMNVKSLRCVGSAEDQEKSAEIRVAKVGVSMFFLHMLAWTPYVIVNFKGIRGDLVGLTPLASMVPAVFTKSVACFDPLVYAANHPKYRIELAKKLPWLSINEKPASEVVSMSTTSEPVGEKP